jgi:hypothetical protein
MFPGRMDFLFLFLPFNGPERDRGRYSVLLRPIQFLKTPLESLKGKFSILGLRSIFGSDYTDTGKEVFETNSGLRFVLSLAARPPRPVSFYDHLFLESFEIGTERLFHRLDLFLQKRQSGYQVIRKWLSGHQGIRIENDVHCSW